MISVHSCVRGRISVHLPEEWRFQCIHVWEVGLWFIWGMMISVHLCLRWFLVHLLEGWWFRCIHVWVVGYGYIGCLCIYLRSDDLQCIHVFGVRFRCIYLRDDDYGAFMCEGYDSSVFTWGMMISVHSCVRCRILVHLPEEWHFAVHSCVRDRIPVHLLDGWWFRCIHVWGVGYRCIYLERDDCDAFMCEGQDSGAFTWGMMISVHSCVCGRISVPLPEEWRFRCIDVWGVRFRCIYLRDDDFSAFMCEG